MSNIKFMYIRDEHRNPVGVIAMRRVEDAVEYAYSVCHPNDKFNKQLARIIATGRLDNSVHIRGVMVTEATSGNDVIKLVLTDLHNHTTSKRAKAFAWDWLETCELLNSPW